MSSLVGVEGVCVGICFLGVAGASLVDFPSDFWNASFEGHPPPPNGRDDYLDNLHTCADRLSLGISGNRGPRRTICILVWPSMIGASAPNPFGTTRPFLAG